MADEDKKGSQEEEDEDEELRDLYSNELLDFLELTDSKNIESSDIPEELEDQLSEQRGKFTDKTQGDIEDASTTELTDENLQEVLRGCSADFIYSLKNALPYIDLEDITLDNIKNLHASFLCLEKTLQPNDLIIISNFYKLVDLAFINCINLADKLPFPLIIVCDCDLFGSDVTVLPEKLTVGRNLNLNNCKCLNVFSDDLDVGGNVYFDEKVDQDILDEALKFKKAGKIKGDIYKGFEIVRVQTSNEQGTEIEKVTQKDEGFKVKNDDTPQEKAVEKKEGGGFWGWVGSKKKAPKEKKGKQKSLDQDPSKSRRGEQGNKSFFDQEFQDKFSKAFGSGDVIKTSEPKAAPEVSNKKGGKKEETSQAKIEKEMPGANSEDAARLKDFKEHEPELYDQFLGVVRNPKQSSMSLDEFLSLSKDLELGQFMIHLIEILRNTDNPVTKQDENITFQELYQRLDRSNCPIAKMVYNNIIGLFAGWKAKSPENEYKFLTVADFETRCVELREQEFLANLRGLVQEISEKKSKKLSMSNFLNNLKKQDQDSNKRMAYFILLGFLENNKDKFPVENSTIIGRIRKKFRADAQKAIPQPQAKQSNNVETEQVSISNQKSQIQNREPEKREKKKSGNLKKALYFGAGAMALAGGIGYWHYFDSDKNGTDEDDTLQNSADIYRSDYQQEMPKTFKGWEVVSANDLADYTKENPSKIIFNCYNGVVSSVFNTDSSEYIPDKIYPEAATVCSTASDQLQMGLFAKDKNEFQTSD